MTLEDLQHIFKKQIDEGTTMLYYMLIDGDYRMVSRCPADRMEDLLPGIDCFQYGGDYIMPRFVK